MVRTLSRRKASRNRLLSIRPKEPTLETAAGTKVADRTRARSSRRQRSQRCDTAAREGTPSGGTKRDAGTPPRGDRQGTSSAMTKLPGPATPGERTKRIEPHDRQQDATSLQVLWRSNPARLCKTARSDARRGSAPPSEAVATPRTAQMPGMTSMEGNGAKALTNPKRGGRQPPTGADGWEIREDLRPDEERSP